ncbi:4-hydroxy-tetrahydrodipicolinate synthase [Thalassotalea atypica]|uniref:4-hydroxy-tetrahydrodipicolinate synthase n=1 Tax=Thalassotalea atypica TaxID=2054316 RepID=UPI0025747B5E|nr:4-hydroxy-tetrahydrodipicolinate synthase [Thalassotalea atypica]
MFFGSIVALITPFTSENCIDFDCVTQLVKWHIDSGTSAIVVAGTTGESPTLSDDEKFELAQHVVDVSQGKIKIIVGNGSNNTYASCQLTRRLNSLNIDGYLTVTPYYNKPTNEGLIAHYSEIARATTLPIILYNVPSRTACDLPNEVVAKLSELSNIVGLKDATADLSRIDKLRAKCGASFTLLSGDDETGFEFCRLGGDGVISVTANVVPQTMAAIQAHLNNNNIKQAKALELDLVALHRDLFIESNPIAVKWALYYLKKIPNALLRLPLTMISSQAKQKIEQTIVKSNLYPQEN